MDRWSRGTFLRLRFRVSESGVFAGSIHVILRNGAPTAVEETYFSRNRFSDQRRRPRCHVLKTGFDNGIAEVHSAWI